MEKLIFENLNNAIDNGYKHDYDVSPLDVVLEMIEYGALDESADQNLAIDIVIEWRNNMNMN